MLWLHLLLPLLFLMLLMMMIVATAAAAIVVAAVVLVVAVVTAVELYCFCCSHSTFCDTFDKLSSLKQTVAHVHRFLLLSTVNKYPSVSTLKTLKLDLEYLVKNAQFLFMIFNASIAFYEFKCCWFYYFSLCYFCCLLFVVFVIFFLKKNKFLFVVVVVVVVVVALTLWKNSLNSC